MARDYIAPNRKQSRSRKYHGKCEECGTPTPANEVYCYVDDTNPAINYSAPYLCKACYEKKYGKRATMNGFEKALDRIKKNVENQDNWSEEDFEHYKTIIKALEIASELTQIDIHPTEKGGVEE